MKNNITIYFLFFFAILKIQAQNQTANLSIQGIVKTIEGAAVENGNYDIVFKIYNVPLGGVVLWADTLEQVKINGGIYSVVLGAQKSLNLPFDEPYYLGVSVDGDIDLYPRARLTSSPYALSLIGDDNIFPNSGNVGVGAASPPHKLTVQVGNGILGLEAEEDANNTSTITTTTDGMTFDAGGTDKAYAFEAGDLVLSEGNLKLNNGAFTFYDEASSPAEIANLGFDPSNGDTLILTNSIGATKIEGNDITLNTSSGTATIEGNTIIDGSTTMNGNVQVNKEGESLQLVGSTNSQMAFYPTDITGGKKADIGVASNGQFTINSTDSDVILNSGSGKRVQTNGLFYANSYKTTYVPQSNHIWERYTGGSYATRQNGRNYHGIRAHEFVVASDKRIKKNFSLSDGQEDLLTLSKIEVTDYRHIDEVANGKENKKGVIAQQVKRVFPEAIKQGVDFIPNVFDFPSALSVKNGVLKVGLNKEHDFEVGDKIRIATVSGDQDVFVSSINSPQEFSIDNWQGSENKKELFIFGKEVDDFHTVDYDRIFTLNVSATQELARKVERLERENAALKERKNKGDIKNEILKADINELSDRMKKIESLLNATGRR